MGFMGLSLSAWVHRYGVDIWGPALPPAPAERRSTYLSCGDHETRGAVHLNVELQPLVQLHVFTLGREDEDGSRARPDGRADHRAVLLSADGTDDRANGSARRDLQNVIAHLGRCLDRERLRGDVVRLSS